MQDMKITDQFAGHEDMKLQDMKKQDNARCKLICSIQLAVDPELLCMEVYHCCWLVKSAHTASVNSAFCMEYFISQCLLKLPFIMI